MRLISCYISGFGKFQNQSFDLSKDIVEFKENNGWGKSTLAAFIESMLFGLSSSRSKQIDENTRVKYTPFGGGAYGGSLQFSYNGNEYRIERTFGKTAAQDSVKLYDKNNRPSFAFGEKIEDLGELLLGVNKESYHRSAYIPQGEIVSEGMPEDTKARLIALLSSSTGKENGAQSALAKLNQAESDLRSKRAPKKGLLDKIEEQIANCGREQAACMQASSQAAALKDELTKATGRLAYVEQQLSITRAEWERVAASGDRAVVIARRQDLERQLLQVEEKLDAMAVFFGEVDPQKVNVGGVQAAVQEYYQLQEWLQGAKPQASNLEQLQAEREVLLARFAECKKNLQTFEMMLDEQNKEAEKTYRKNLRLRRSSKKKDVRSYVLVAGFVMVVLGAIWWENAQSLGYVVMALGGGAIGLTFLLEVLATRFWERPRRKKRFSDPALNAQYKEAQQRYEALKYELKTLGFESGEDVQALMTEMEQKQQRAMGLQKAIEDFLANFRFEEMYDYRAALAMLKEKQQAYTETLQLREEYIRQSDALPRLDAVGEYAGAVETSSIDELKRRIAEFEGEKNALQQAIAQQNAAMSGLETQACALAEKKAEEQALLQEKTRLEHKLSVIQTAKTLLERARENLAARYLEPVEKRVAEFLRQLGREDGKTLRFAADGLPLLDDKGALRPMAYYSVGTQELIGFCTRLALMESLYVKTPPVLILDDPFVNLDDPTTALCKRLLQRLAKNYQIIYCTCKEERRLHR